MIQPIFAIGIGITEGQEHLEYARKLFKSYKNMFEPIENSNGMYTTLNDYVGNDDNKTALASEVKDTGFGKFILDSAIDYLTQQGFDTDKHHYQLQNVWLNEMKSGSSHRTHSHSGFDVSGCFYVDVPDQSNQIGFEGFLSRFDRKHLPVEDYTFFNSDTWTLNMSEGQLGCWNSYLRHFVPEQTFNGIRRTIAFDISAVKQRK